jgi:acyl-CoA thioesterase FadM
MSVDDGIFYQPVQAYFQFINEGNINLFRQEAAERHSQIMEQMVQQLCQDYENRSLNVEQMCVNEPAQQLCANTHLTLPPKRILLLSVDALS